PRVLGEINDMHVKAVKLKGEFLWHHHDAEDELFLVVKGTLRMKFRGHEAVVREGEFVIVPRGVEHCPVADEEAHIVLIEPKSTRNTGYLVKERTDAHLERICAASVIRSRRSQIPMERRFYTLDVFTTARFEGNPLAVITDGDGLSNDAMLAVAREMNLSETVFVQKPTEDQA